jgi:hypothetical protein
MDQDGIMNLSNNRPALIFSAAMCVEKENNTHESYAQRLGYGVQQQAV